MKSHNYEGHGRIKNASQGHGKGSHGRRVSGSRQQASMQQAKSQQWKLKAVYHQYNKMLWVEKLCASGLGEYLWGLFPPSFLPRPPFLQARAKRALKSLFGAKCECVSKLLLLATMANAFQLITPKLASIEQACQINTYEQVFMMKIPSPSAILSFASLFNSSLLLSALLLFSSALL
tara:strand:- start:420 stop:950 length:531 start_codon:yes stop_codon:yes gene_type:complete